MSCQYVLAVLAALALSAASVHAKPFADMFPGRKYENPQAQQFVESLDYKDGMIALGVGGVQLKVPQGFYYLSAEHSRHLSSPKPGAIRPRRPRTCSA